MTIDPRFERRVVAELARLERVARRRSPAGPTTRDPHKRRVSPAGPLDLRAPSPPRRNDPMPKNTISDDTTSNGHHPALAERLRRGLLPLPPPRPLNPALLKDAEQRAENAQNRIADKITAFSGSMAFVYLHVIWFGCWIGFGVEKYPFGLLTMIVSLEAIFLSTFVMISQNRADAKRQVVADEQWKTVQEEDQQNQELLDLSKQILDLTKEVHANYRSTSGPASSLSTSSDGAK
jgi:low affinity Fe/Cu permease